MKNPKVLRPVNQKSVYHSFADLYEKLMNGEISIEQAEIAGGILSGMNRTFALEIKRAQVDFVLKGGATTVESKAEMRVIEAKGFDNIPIEENATV